MTEEDREQLKAELMKTGFWDEDAGDPTTEDAAFTELYHELEYRLR